MTPKNEELKTRIVNVLYQTDIKAMEIRVLDWQRIFREVKSIPAKKSFHVPIACVLFGVGTTAFLSLPPLYWAAQDVNPWVKPIYWLTGFAAILIGLITWKHSEEIDKMKESSCRLIQQDMEEINSTFFSSNELDKDT